MKYFYGFVFAFASLLVGPFLQAIVVKRNLGLIESNSLINKNNVGSSSIQKTRESLKREFGFEDADFKSVDDFKKAFRRLAPKYHPDKNPQLHHGVFQRFNNLFNSYLTDLFNLSSPVGLSKNNEMLQQKGLAVIKTKDENAKPESFLRQSGYAALGAAHDFSRGAVKVARTLKRPAMVAAAVGSVGTALSSAGKGLNLQEYSVTNNGIKDLTYSLLGDGTVNSSYIKFDTAGKQYSQLSDFWKSANRADVAPRVFTPSLGKGGQAFNDELVSSYRSVANMPKPIRDWYEGGRSTTQTIRDWWNDSEGVSTLSTNPDSWLSQVDRNAASNVALGLAAVTAVGVGSYATFKHVQHLRSYERFFKNYAEYFQKLADGGESGVIKKSSYEAVANALNDLVDYVDLEKNANLRNAAGFLFENVKQAVNALYSISKKSNRTDVVKLNIKFSGNVVDELLRSFWFLVENNPGSKAKLKNVYLNRKHLIDLSSTIAASKLTQLVNNVLIKTIDDACVHAKGLIGQQVDTAIKSKIFMFGKSFVLRLNKRGVAQQLGITSPLDENRKNYDELIKDFFDN